MNLSPHFTLEELTFTTHRQFDNTPPPSVIENLQRLAPLLEEIRALLGGRPVVVDSGYRSPAVNAAVGGKPTSQHLLGCAADIRVPGVTADQVVRTIRSSTLPFDQLIREYDAWTHVSVPSVLTRPPRRMALIIDKDGPRPYA